VKDKLADVRAKLVILISDWDTSGNGGGNRAETDKDFGHSISEGTLVDDDRKYFSKESQPHLLLYLWHVMDELQLLQSTLTVIPKPMAASSESIPESQLSAKKRRILEKQAQDKDEKFKEAVANSFKSLSKNQAAVTMTRAHENLGAG
jgi:hypothetical protein